MIRFNLAQLKYPSYKNPLRYVLDCILGCIFGFGLIYLVWAKPSWIYSSECSIGILGGTCSFGSPLDEMIGTLAGISTIAGSLMQLKYFLRDIVKGMNVKR